MDGHEYQLQPAEDTAFLYQVYASTRSDEMKRTGWSEVTIEQFLRFQFKLQHVQYHNCYPNAAYFIICVGEDRVGRLYINRCESEIRVIDISLLPEFRRKGLGTCIMNNLIKEAETAHLPLRLSVRFDNPACHLYKRLGFCVANDGGYYLDMERTALKTL